MIKKLKILEDRPPEGKSYFSTGYLKVRDEEFSAEYDMYLNKYAYKIFKLEQEFISLGYDMELIEKYKELNFDYGSFEESLNNAGDSL